MTIALDPAAWDPLWSLLAGVLITLLLTTLIAWRIVKRRVHEAYEAGLVSADAENREARARLEQRLDDGALEITRLQTRLEAQGVRLDASERTLETLRQSYQEACAEVSAARARLEETGKAFAEKEALFKASGDALKQEFELLANRIFESQGEMFARRQETRLTSLLNPFKDQMADFRKKVEEVYHTEAKERASLLTEVRNLQRSSERINEEAENLARALKGDKKLQGNWGELVLERVLEDSGLRKDHEYLVQETRRSRTGDLKRPDVLIRLPDNKDVVVDAKVSLNAYERALATEDDNERERAVRQHVINLRSHVNRLSEQDYDELSDVRSLDFVLLFIPIESAFTLAMENEPSLFSDAFEKRIVIVSPTTLMMTLRIINNVWRYEKQNRNAQVIADKAGALYDKLRLLVEDMTLLGRQLQSVDKTYQSAFGKLAAGRGNLVKQVEQFRELGARVKKPLPAATVDEAAADDD